MSKRYYSTRVTWSSRDHLLFITLLLISCGIEILRTSNSNQKSLIVLFFYAVLLIGIMSAYGFLIKRLAVKRKSLPSHILKSIDSMNGIQFEKYIASILPSQGYKSITLTERFDLGIDIIAQKDSEIWGIQIKRQSNPIGVLAIRQVVTALKYYDCNHAMIITNSILSKSAKKLAKSNNCIVIDRTMLLNWINTIK